MRLWKGGGKWVWRQGLVKKSMPKRFESGGRLTCAATLALSPGGCGDADVGRKAGHFYQL
jgi:hypothetical protein